MWRLRTVAACEGVAVDGRGLLTLVGFEPPAVVVAEIPGHTAPTIVTVLQGDEDDRGGYEGVVSVRTEVTAPDGTTVFVTEYRQQMVATDRGPGLPRMQNVVQTPFVASKIGLYRAKTSVRLGDDEPIVGEVDFYVADRTSTQPNNASS